MKEDKTTLWENIKSRVQFLKSNHDLIGEGAELGLAITEELERIYNRIEKIEKRLEMRERMEYHE